MVCESVKQHCQPVESYTYTARGRHPVRKRANIVFIHLVRFVISAFAFLQLRFKAPPLILRIVEFAEAVGNLHLSGKHLETLRPIRLIRLLLGER